MHPHALTDARTRGPASPRSALRRPVVRRLLRLVLGSCAAILAVPSTARGDRERETRALIVEKATAALLTTHVRFSVTPPEQPRSSASPLEFGTCAYEARQQGFTLTSAPAVRGVVTSLPAWSWDPAGQAPADDALQGGAYVVVLGGRPPIWQTVYPSGVTTETARAVRDALCRQVAGKSLFDLSSAALLVGADASNATRDVEFSVDSLELDIGVASPVSGRFTTEPGHVVVAFQSRRFAPMWPGAEGTYAPRAFHHGVIARGIVRSIGDGGVEARFDVRVHDDGGESTRFFVDATWIVSGSHVIAARRPPDGSGPRTIQGARVLVEDADSGTIRVVGAMFDAGSDAWVVPTLSLLDCDAVLGVSPAGVVKPLAELVATERRGHVVVLRSGPSTQGLLAPIGGESKGPPVATLLGSSTRPISATVVSFATLSEPVLGQVWGVEGNTESARAGLPAVDASGAVVGIVLSDPSPTTGVVVAPHEGVVLGSPFEFVASSGSPIDHMRKLTSDDGPLHALGIEAPVDDVPPAAPEQFLGSLRQRVQLHPRSAPLQLACVRAEAAFGSPEAAGVADDAASAVFPAVRVPGLLSVLRAVRLRDRQPATPREMARLASLAEHAWIQVPGNDDAKLTYASACMATSRFTRAMRILELVPLTSADGCRTRVDLAQRLERVESPIDTVSIWRAACAAQPACTGSVEGLHAALERRGRTAELVESLDATRPGWRRDVDAVESVLRCALNRGSSPDVSTWYATWIALSPIAARIPLITGRVLAARGDVAAATSELRRAAVVSGHDLEAMVQIATVLIQIDSVAVAEEVVQAIENLDAATGQRLRLQLDRKRPTPRTR